MIAKRLRRVAQRIDRMSQRERLLIFASLLAAVLLGWYQFAMLPALSSEKRAVEGIDAARARIEAVDTAVSAQAGALGADNGWSLAARLGQVHRRAGEVQALIDARAAEIVDPATMAQVLQDLLARQRGLRLIRALNMDAERLPESDDDAPLFRHTLRLELEGPYLAVLDYLTAIESLPWQIYWQHVEIDAHDYPRNRVRIDIGTLSFEEDWIGV